MARTGMTWDDIGRIQWGPTMKLALGRGAASGLIIAVVLVAMGPQEGGATPAEALVVWAVWSVAACATAPLLQLFLKGIAAVFAAMHIGIAVFATNVMIWGAALLVAIGDPIVFALNKAFPWLFEARDFAFINLQPAIFILADIEDDDTLARDRA